MDYEQQKHLALRQTYKIALVGGLLVLAGGVLASLSPHADGLPGWSLYAPIIFGSVAASAATYLLATRKVPRGGGE